MTVTETLELDAKQRGLGELISPTIVKEKARDIFGPALLKTLPKVLKGMSIDDAEYLALSSNKDVLEYTLRNTLEIILADQKILLSP